MSNICFLLTCLLFPLFIGLLDLQSQLSLSNTGHTLAEIFIILAIFWLILLIDRFDRWLYLRSFSAEKKGSLEQNRSTTRSNPAPETGLSFSHMDDRNPTQQAESETGLSTGLYVPSARVSFRKLFNRNGQ